MSSIPESAVSEGTAEATIIGAPVVRAPLSPEEAKERSDLAKRRWQNACFKIIALAYEYEVERRVAEEKAIQIAAAAAEAAAAKVAEEAAKRAAKALAEQGLSPAARKRLSIQRSLKMSLSTLTDAKPQSISVPLAPVGEEEEAHTPVKSSSGSSPLRRSMLRSRSLRRSVASSIGSSSQSEESVSAGSAGSDSIMCEPQSESQDVSLSLVFPLQWTVLFQGMNIEYLRWRPRPPVRRLVGTSSSKIAQTESSCHP